MSIFNPIKSVLKKFGVWRDGVVNNMTPLTESEISLFDPIEKNGEFLMRLGVTDAERLRIADLVVDYEV